MAQSRWLFPSLSFVAGLALFVPNRAAAECCDKCWDTCADGYQCGAWDWYCGVGSCNIFGCNCDGGCRQPHDKKQCDGYCDSSARHMDNHCTYGCPPQVLDECSIQCSELAARYRESCHRDCDKRFPGGTAAKVPSVGPLTGLIRFAAADADRNGKIDEKELGAFLPARQGGKGGDVATSAQALAGIDKNKNRELTLDEVDADGMAYVQANRASLKLPRGVEAAYVQKVIAAAAPARKAGK